MSDEQWRRAGERTIRAALAHAPDLKKTPESDHPQKTLQAKVIDR